MYDFVQWNSPDLSQQVRKLLGSKFYWVQDAVLKYVRGRLVVVYVGHITVCVNYDTLVVLTGKLR